MAVVDNFPFMNPIISGVQFAIGNYKNNNSKNIPFPGFLDWKTESSS